MASPGLVIAAPSSGSGKTVFTLGLLRALARRGVAVASAKVGPDYIDPAFHAAASGRPCANLDAWAMRPASIAARIAALSSGSELVICEGVMGLFDGADLPPGQPCGSTADVAAVSGWPVVLLVDVRGQAASVAALIRGFIGFRPDVPVAGVVFNRVNSPAHRAMIERACAAALPGLPLLGWLPREGALSLPERHLGLVQACEHSGLEAQLDAAAAVVEASVDLDALCALARPSGLSGVLAAQIPPLGQHIAVARDDAFAFAYPTLLEGWRLAGAALSFFSPLADEAPAADADAVYLPGGYPELHAGRLAAAERFLAGLRQPRAAVFGECGGYMTLGDGIEDKDGQRHAMAGLLPLETSFAKRKLHLGYRRATLLQDGPLGPKGDLLRGHEFHYATITREGEGQALFQATDASGRALGEMGRRVGPVMGSFLHLIDREEAA